MNTLNILLIVLLVAAISVVSFRMGYAAALEFILRVVIEAANKGDGDEPEI